MRRPWRFSSPGHIYLHKLRRRAEGWRFVRRGRRLYAWSPCWYTDQSGHRSIIRP